MVSELVSALIMAIIQGLTEWIPVSSSGHLVLAGRLLGYSGDLLFDVALHFGTLMAAFVYFGKDIVDIVEDVLRFRTRSRNFRMGMFLIVATIPAAFAGFVFRNYLEIAFDRLGILALGFGVTGLFLMIASLNITKEKKLGYRESFLIGCAQVFALLPGVSRSGATISSGSILGLNEKEAVKFSFLMSIPVILGANILVVGDNALPKELIWATLVSFVAGLGTIHILIKYVLTDKKRFRWFGGYCLLLALIVGAVAFL